MDFEEGFHSIELAWPEGVPAKERAIWSTLDQKRRAAAARRIMALVGYEREGDWSRWTAVAGMSRPGFFTMLRKWRTDRSIASIVPGARARQGRRRGGTLGSDATDAVTRAVAANPDWSKYRVIEHVRRQLATPPAASSLRALVDAAQVAEERRALGGEEGFGRRVVVATSPLVLRRSKDVDWQPGAEGCFVVDVATDRILAHAACMTAEQAFAEAAFKAAELFRSLDEPAEAGPIPEIEMHLAVGNVWIMRKWKSVRGLPIRLADDPPGRTRASRLMQLLGPKLGVLEVLPRAEVHAAPIDGADPGDPRGPQAAAEAVRGLLEAEVARRRSEDAGTLPRAAVSTAALAEAFRLLAS